MTRQQIERRLYVLGLRLEPAAYERWRGIRWIVRPDTVGPCRYGQVTELKSLREAATLVDMREIQQDLWDRAFGEDAA